MRRIVDKMRGNRLRCFGLVIKRKKSDAVRVVMEINVERRRREEN